MTTAATTVYQAFQDTVRTYGRRDMLCLVADTAERYGQKPRSITYRQADQQVRRLIAAYRNRGVAPQSRVALGLDNRPQFFYHWLALNALGASVVPLNPHWRTGELQYVLAHSEAQCAVVLAERVESVHAAAADGCEVLSATDGLGAEPNKNQSETVPDKANPAKSSVLADGNADAAPCAIHFDKATQHNLGEDARRDPPTNANSGRECALLYTSGTTGRPKGCLLDNEYFLSSGAWYRDLGGYCALQPGEDRLITPLPMHHMNAMATSTMAMLLTGGCIVPLDRFHPRSWWASVRESGATIMHYLGVMPALLMNLAESPEDRSHRVRFGFGAGLSGELHTAFERRFAIPLIEAWAMTETGCSVAIAASTEPRKLGTGCLGRVPPHVDYRIVDDRDQDVAVGDPGELLVRRAGAQPRRGLFRGYLKDPAATQAAWAGGYFRTGDLVRLDAEGLLHFVDRKKNVIRRSGENISAVEVEEILIEHPAVVAAGVAAVPDAVRGDEVFACVVVNNGTGDWPKTAAAIVRHCLDRLAYYKAPGYIARCAELPLTATEKIQRAALTELAGERYAKGDCTDTRALKKADV